jgi:hypothetical protein
MNLAAYDKPNIIDNNKFNRHIPLNKDMIGEVMSLLRN